MNTADSQLLASELERHGLQRGNRPRFRRIFLVVNNLCRPAGRRRYKALGSLGLLNELKKEQPDKVIGVMGCLVGRARPAGAAQEAPLRRCLHVPVRAKSGWSIFCAAA